MSNNTQSTLQISLSKGPSRITYGKYKGAEVYFTHPIAEIFYHIKDAWDMRNIIDLLKMESCPAILLKSVNTHRYGYYDNKGMILHREYICNGTKFYQRDVKSPFIENYTTDCDMQSNNVTNSFTTNNIITRDILLKHSTNTTNTTNSTVSTNIINTKKLSNMQKDALLFLLKEHNNNYLVTELS